MRTIPFLAAAAAAALALAACDPDRSRYELVLQPDGSGRFRVARHVDRLDAPPALDPDARARREAGRFLDSIDGVAAWTEVGVTALPGGRAQVHATGWFEALSDVRLPGRQAFTATPDGEALEVRYLDPGPDRVARLLTADDPRTRTALAMDDLDFEATAHRLRGFVEMWLSGWRFEAEVQLPGPIVECYAFERLAPDRVAVRRDVVAVLEALDRGLEVVDAARRLVRRGTLSEAEGWAQVAERLPTASPCVVRCTLPCELPPQGPASSGPGGR